MCDKTYKANIHMYRCVHLFYLYLNPAICLATGLEYDSVPI